MNYTAPNKVNNAPWSADEHNQMKQAINSKFDSTNVITDPSQASNTTVLSSGATNALFQSFLTAGMQYRGELTGAEDLNDGAYQIPGFWFGRKLDFNSTANGSVPIEVRGLLIAYGNDVFAVQQFITLQDGNDTFVRNCIRETNVWSAWIKMASQSWVSTNYTSTPIQGTPNVTVGNGASVDIHDSKDLKGYISVSNQTTQIIPAGTNIIVNFSHDYSDLHVIMLTPVIEELKVAAYGSPNPNNAIIRIMNDLPIGSSINFFYLIQ